MDFFLKNGKKTNENHDCLKGTKPLSCHSNTKHVSHSTNTKNINVVQGISRQQEAETASSYVTLFQSQECFINEQNLLGTYYTYRFH